MLTTFTALYDANVLYPAALRSLLMYLALSGLYRARWSELIHDEWTQRLLANRPDLSPQAITRTRTLMNAHADGALVTDFEHLVPALTLPDPKDRHVLAAAIRGQASVIVTYNLSDFPDQALKSYGIEAQHPDVFIDHLFDLEPHAVVSAARDQLRDLKHPPIGPDDFLKQLEQLQLPMTAANLREYKDLLS